MKTKLLAFVIVSISMFIILGCTKMPPLSDEPLDDIEISLYEGYSYPMFVISELAISGDGSVKLMTYNEPSRENNGKANVTKTGSLTKDEFLALIGAFEENRFFSLKGKYDCGNCLYVIAPSSTEITFKKSSFEKSVIDVGSS